MARTRSHPAAAAAWLHFGGAVAQLGERLVRNEEVRGSTPLGSTKKALDIPPNSSAVVLEIRAPGWSGEHMVTTYSEVAITDMCTLF
jgi:hypothetical protein